MKEIVAIILLAVVFSIILSNLGLGFFKTISISTVLAMFYEAILNSKNK